MKPKSNAAIQLGMDRATAFNLIAVIGKAAVAGKWDLPHGMLEMRATLIRTLDPVLSIEKGA